MEWGVLARDGVCVGSPEFSSRVLKWGGVDLGIPVGVDLEWTNQVMCHVGDV